MADETTRTLTTIVSIDAAGYSAAAERDDDRAVEVVTELRQQVSKIAAQHQGRVFNTAGDGVMLEFSSADGALRAVLAMLADEIIIAARARFGMHVGDVHRVQDGDLLGHGVNVAARLQALASPGTALASGALIDLVRGQLTRGLSSLGRVRLDKMDEALEVFVLSPGNNDTKPSAAFRRAATRALPMGLISALAVGAVIILALGVSLWFFIAPPSEASEPLIAVLPFDSLNGGAEGQLISSGVSEDILNAMTRLGTLRVIARNSSFSFHDKGQKEKAGRVLHATHVLDGSVRWSKGRILVNVALMDVESNENLWSGRFDRDAATVLALQDEIARAVVDKLEVRKTAVSAVMTPAVDPEAYELFLKGRKASLLWTPSKQKEAIDLFTAAVAKAPTFADAWAELAGAQIDSFMFGLLTTAETDRPALRRTLEAARASSDRALALDPNNGRALSYLDGFVPYHFWAERLAISEKAVASAPTSAPAMGSRARNYFSVGWHKRAATEMARAVALDPLNDVYLVGQAEYLEAAGKPGEAREMLAIVAKRTPENLFVWRTLLDFSMADRDFARAEETFKTLGSDWPVLEDLLRPAVGALKSGKTRDIENVRRILRKTGKEPSTTPEVVAVLNWFGRTDEAFALVKTHYAATPRGAGFPRSLEEAYDRAPIFLDAGRPFRWFKSLISDPRYLWLMDSSGLLDFWITTGVWPDFCSEPSLPYDCEVEARKVVAARTRK